MLGRRGAAGAFGGAIAAVVALMTVAGPAAAQNHNAYPVLGNLDLVTGFTPDPRVFQAPAGGAIDLEKTQLPSDCVGFVSNEPTLQVHYQAGTYPLIFATRPEDDLDTVLLVRTPDGQWLCNDDSEAEGVEADITILRPASGYYDVWVGTYLPRGAMVPLMLTEEVLGYYESGW